MAATWEPLIKTPPMATRAPHRGGILLLRQRKEVSQKWYTYKELYQLKDCALASFGFLRPFPWPLP